MSTQRIHDVLQQKHFYRNHFRGTAKALQYSLLVTVILCISIAYTALTKPGVTFYASNASGAGFITQLQPLDKPNMSSQALLPTEQTDDMGAKPLTVK